MQSEQILQQSEEQKQVRVSEKPRRESTEIILNAYRKRRSSSLADKMLPPKSYTQPIHYSEKKLKQEETKKKDKSKGVINSMLKYGVHDDSGNLFYRMRGRNYLWNLKSETYLLGTCYKPNQKEKFQADLKTVLWFSYREGFPILPCSDSKKYSYSSDWGWGCMIRVGQMMLAEVLKRNIFTIDGEYLTHMLDHSLVKICEYFADINEKPLDAPFSIHGICNEALLELKKEPGKWYTSSGIIFILKSIMERYSAQLVSFPLKIILFNEGVIFEDQILANASMPVVEFCKGKSQKLEKVTEEAKDEKIVNFRSRQMTVEDIEWNHGIFIVVSCKTGLEKPDKESLPSISTLLKFRQSVGILSGRGRKAYYIIGVNGKDLLYLDPHYVQKAAKNKDAIRDMMQTYTVQECLSMRIEKLSTCAGFGFYIDNKKEYLEFKRDLKLAKEKDPNLLIAFEEKTPTFQPDMVQSVIISEKKVEDFEILDDSCLSSES